MNLRHLALLHALVMLAAPAVAADVYRCGSDGRAYGDQPCAEGRRIEVDDRAAAPSRPRAATRQTAYDERLAKPVGATPRAQRGEAATAATAAAKPAAPGGFRLSTSLSGPERPQARTAQARAGDPARRPPSAASRRQGEADGTFRAVAPSSRRAKG